MDDQRTYYWETEPERFSIEDLKEAARLLREKYKEFYTDGKTCPRCRVALIDSWPFEKCRLCAARDGVEVPADLHWTPAAAIRSGQVKVTNDKE
jgi:hypothetical protein